MQWITWVRRLCIMLPTADQQTAAECWLRPTVEITTGILTITAGQQECAADTVRCISAGQMSTFMAHISTFITLVSTLIILTQLYDPIVNIYDHDINIMKLLL